MHISDGVLSAQVLAAGWALAGVGTAVGLRKTDPDKIVRVAFASSVFFLASLVNVRIPPSSAHLSLLAPVGLILGWSAFPALLVALLLQALLLQFGGISTLGINAVNVAIPALLASLLFSGPIRRASGPWSAALAFAAGFGAVLLCAAQVAFILYMSDKGMMNVSYFVFAAHLPLAVVEGVVTLFMVSFLKRTAPDLLQGVDR